MSAIRLHLVMPCARPGNIPILAPLYLQQMEPHPFELRWHIMLQGPDPDPKGIRKVNEGINDIQSGWIMAPADDTDQYPALFRRLHEVIVANPQAGAILFHQDRGHGILRVSPGSLCPGAVCGGQIAWKREFLGDHRFDYDNPEVGAYSDGVLITKLFKLYPEKFVFVDEVLTKFGSLE